MLVTEPLAILALGGGWTLRKVPLRLVVLTDRTSGAPLSPEKTATHFWALCDRRGRAVQGGALLCRWRERVARLFATVLN